MMNHPTGSLRFARVACSLAGTRKPVVHVYLLAGGPEEATAKAAAAFRDAGCRPLSAAPRRVLDHAPREYVYAVDLVLEKA